MTWSPAALGIGLAAALFASTVAVAAPAEEKPRDCFFITQWKGWSAPNGDTLYLRVEPNAVYRVDLTPGSHARKWPDRRLVSRMRGSNSICSHLDLNLALADSNGFESPLIARSIVKLTPEEVAAIPKKDLP